MNNKALITTTDNNTKDFLIENGFTLIYSQYNMWTFLNDESIKIMFDSSHKYTYTNKLCI